MFAYKLLLISDLNNNLKLAKQQKEEEGEDNRQKQEVRSENTLTMSDRS
jgi:hypothetical protein